MSYNLSPMPKFFALNDNGLPLAGGQLFTYIAGTSTPKATYAYSDGSANTNPVILDSAGRADVRLDTGAYKFVLKDSTGNVVWSVDGIGQDTLLSNVVSTIAGLRELTANSAAIVFVSGYTATGDGGGGTFFWDSTNTDDDDAGIIIKPTGYSGSGRWVRLLNGFVTPKMYGAQGQGTVDDSAAVFAADIYAAANGIHVLLQDGTYLISSGSFTAKVVFSPLAILSWAISQNPVISATITDKNKHFALSNSAWAPVLSGMSNIYPEWFGAVGDGSFANNTKTTDDTTAIQLAVNSCSAGKWVVLDSSKKYWCNSVAWKSGVNLRGTQALENDTLGAASTEFLANLQFAGASGSFIVLGSGRGPIIRDLIIDGNALTSIILDITASDSLIDYCTIRNASLTSGTAINFKGTGTGNTVNNCTVYNCQNGIVSSASQTYGKIVDSNILACVNGISLGNGLGWIVAQNSTFQISDADIIVSGSGYKIIDNVLNDISGIGITIANSAIQSADVSGNTISAITHSAVIGIQITSSVISYVNCVKNVLYMLSSLTGCTGIKTVNNGAVLPGDIFDNQVTNFNTPYDVGDGYSTAQRTQDAYGLKVYKQVVGNASLESAYDKANSQQVVINPNDIGSSVGIGHPITSIGGRVSNITIYNRRHLTKYGAGAGYVGARFHDALELDNTNLTPRTDTRAWYERDFNDGSHHWGDMATENMRLDGNGLYVNALSFGEYGVVIKPPITYGVRFGGFDTTDTFIYSSIIYQPLVNQVSVYLPLMSGTWGNAGSYNSFIMHAWDITYDAGTTQTIGTGIFNFTIPTNRPIISGQRIRIEDNSSPLNYMTGTVSSYNSATGALSCIMSANGGRGEKSSWKIISLDFPFVGIAISPAIAMYQPSILNINNNLICGTCAFNSGLGGAFEFNQLNYATLVPGQQVGIKSQVITIMIS
jgi:hypothetical protein